MNLNDDQILLLKTIMEGAMAWAGEMDGVMDDDAQEIRAAVEIIQQLIEDYENS